MTTEKIETIQELALATGLSPATIRAGISDVAKAGCGLVSDIACRKSLLEAICDKIGNPNSDNEGGEVRRAMSRELFERIYS